MTIGEKIKQRRIELGMSQDELAKKVGYAGKSSINKIENGERPLRQSKILPMVEALNITVGYLLGIDDAAPAAVPESAKRLKAYMDKLEKLNPEGLKKAGEYIDLLALNDKFTKDKDEEK